EHPDTPVESAGAVAGALDRRPCALEKQALLGVHGFGFARAVPKEARVEEIHPRQNGASSDKSRIGRGCRPNSGHHYLIMAEERNRLLPGAQIFPVRIDVLRPW